jgi:ABC-2 type transport system permease protein
MKHIQAIFKKQLKDTFKNPSVLLQFIIYPVIAFIILRLIGNIENMLDFEGMPEDMLALAQEIARANMHTNMPDMMTMQATIFAGMGLIPIVAGIIAEDIEKKSLRFLMMAGVKPLSYLLGVGGVVFIAGFFTSVAFAFIGEFTGADFLIFTAAMMSAVAGSIVLGGIIGIFTKNQQAAQGLSLPVAVILGFGPMMAQFNTDIARWLRVFYTQQLNVIADCLTTGAGETNLLHSFAVIWANIAVLIALFAFVFKKKGLRSR